MIYKESLEFHWCKIKNSWPYEVVVDDQKPVDYQALCQFFLQAEGEEVDWQGAW